MGLLRRWVARQFTTRVIVLMPVAIAINIVLGYTVQSGLKLPIYMDSIGTILVGVLGGPLPGLFTGVLTNLIWQYAPGIGSGSQIGPFAITAGVIGLLAGVWGQLGLFRSRRGHVLNIAAASVTVILLAITALYTYSRAYSSENAFNSNVFTLNTSMTFDQSRLIFLGVMVVFVAIVAWALFLRRDVGVVFAISAGLATGITAAIVSAPIYAFFYGGVSGSGTDAIVAAFRSGGDSLYQATLKQGLLSDPVDKMITTFVVFFILGSLSRRFVARFPNGEKLIGPEAEPDAAPPADPAPKAASDAG
jgi:energy-coupling factor transport system substrate-specific component